MWSSATSGYCGVDLGDDVLPELEGLEHVGLVDAGERACCACAPPGRRRGRCARSRGACSASCRRLPRRRRSAPSGDGAAAARLAEVDVAGELADDQDVQPGDQFGLQARRVRQLLVADRRAEVGEQARGACAGRGSPARGAARARACRTSSRRPRRTAPRRRPGPASAWRRAADGRAPRRRRRRPARSRSRSGRSSARSTLHGLGDDLGADAVAGQDCDLHGGVPWSAGQPRAPARACFSSRSASKARILSAWRSVRPMSSKPLSRQYLRNGSTSKGSSAPSGLTTTWRSQVDRQLVADEGGDLVEQLRRPALAAARSAAGRS